MTAPPWTTAELRAAAMAEVVALGRAEVRSWRAVDGRLGGQRRGVRRGGGVEFAEHRDYAPGDDLRRLDWRALARNDRLYIKQFEQEVHASALFLVDASASMALVDDTTAGGTATVGLVDKWRRVQVLLATLALLVARQGDAFGLHVCGRQAPPPTLRTGPAQIVRLLADLAALRPDGAAGLPELVAEGAMTQPSVVIVVSDVLADPAHAIAPLGRIRRAGPDVLLLHTLHPLELGFGFRRPVELRCAERGNRLRVEPRVVRQRYLAMMAAHREAVRQRCLDAGVRHEAIDLGEPLAGSLRRALADLHRGRR